VPVEALVRSFVDGAVFGLSGWRSPKATKFQISAVVRGLDELEDEAIGGLLLALDKPFEELESIHDLTARLRLGERRCLRRGREADRIFDDGGWGGFRASGKQRHVERP
jgi:hypothetical protein